MLDAATATWPEVQTFLARRPVAILAFGAHEEHGPHAPLQTDTLLAGELARRLAAALDLLLLPSIPYGETWSAGGYPGTVSLSFATVQAILADLGGSLAAGGVRALVVVNGHFGNHAPLEQAARGLHGQGFPVLALDYPGLERLALEICESAAAAPGFYHADEVETSMLLACAPDTVQAARAVAEYPVFPAHYGLTPIRLHEFCRSGVFGDPRPATAEKGERFFAGLTAVCADLIAAFTAELGV
ncbi:MAG: creatininase family protein [Caldilineaceae bacterium]|nr:creatininase family protein [Caldilineaceae bacterium]